MFVRFLPVIILSFSLNAFAEDSVFEKYEAKPKEYLYCLQSFPEPGYCKYGGKKVSTFEVAQVNGYFQVEKEEVVNNFSKYSDRMYRFEVVKKENIIK